MKQEIHTAAKKSEIVKIKKKIEFSGSTPKWQKNISF